MSDPEHSPTMAYDPHAPSAADAKAGQPSNSTASVHLEVTVDAKDSAATGGDNQRAGSLSAPRGERYTATRFHARGGIGEVWLANDRDLEREVALKQLRPEHAANADVRHRFLAEAKITGQLEHPGIVPIYDLAISQDDQQPCYAMRFLKGRTLSESIREYHDRRARGQTRPTELTALLNAFITICNTVDYAHSRGVIHRDLKSQNVILGDFGETIVVDWGLAKVVGQREQLSGAAAASGVSTIDSGLTVAGQILGTPAYMPPEQAQGRLDDLDQRADVYSLGAILYEILTGKPPFVGRDFADILQRILHEPPLRPKTMNPSLALPLEAACLKALSKQPDDRYSSARELAQDVQRFLADEPVSCYSEPFAARAARWGRRHKTKVMAAAVVLIMTVIGLAAGTALLTQANRRISEARHRAVANAREMQRQKTIAERNAIEARRQSILAKHSEAEANRQRGIAEDNFRQATSAVDDYLTAVSQNQLLNQPGLQPLRRQLLNLALQYYQGFIQQRTGEHLLKRDLALAYSRVADIQGQLGELPQAVQSGEQSLVLFDELIAENPGLPEHRHNKAVALNGQALLYQRQARFEEALAAFTAAVGLMDEIARSLPATDFFQAELAATLVNQALLHSQLGRMQEAIRAYERAIEIFVPLMAGHPDELRYQSNLAGAYGNLGNLQRLLALNDNAIHSYEKSIELLEALTTRDSGNLESQSGLANAYENLSILYNSQQNKEQAEAALTDAVSIRERLASENPAVVKYQFGLARCYINLGAVLNYSADAEAPLKKAASLLEALAANEPTNVNYKNLLGAAYGNLGLMYRHGGKPEQAILMYEKGRDIQRILAKDHPEVVEFPLFLAAQCVNLANVLREVPRFDDALASLDEAEQQLSLVLERAPQHATAKSYSANLTYVRGQTLSFRAWQLATSSAAEQRDGARAIADATKACELLDWKDAAALDHLAAAYAEAGDFAAALRWVDEALRFAPAELQAELELRRELYREMKPFRQQLE